MPVTSLPGPYGTEGLTHGAHFRFVLVWGADWLQVPTLVQTRGTHTISFQTSQLS